MCGYELAKRGKRVIILEARDRVGGRIWQLEEGFGFPVQVGAEFVHSKAPVTKELAQEAGLTIIPLETEVWRAESGEFIKSEGTASYREALNEKLGQLTKDVPIATFLETYFGGEEYKPLRDFISTLVEQYDAADPRRMSTFSLRDEWLGEEEWEQARIQEGYGPLLHFLESRCRQVGVDVYLGEVVQTITAVKDIVTVSTMGKNYTAQQVVVTVPLPLLRDIRFEPALPEKMEAISKIGFGGVIKTLLLFRDKWWAGKIFDKEPRTTRFVIADEPIAVWWEPYREHALLVGWVAGPKAEKLKNLSKEEVAELALASLANIFGVEKDVLRKKLVTATVGNWLADTFARGAYSYPTPETVQAFEKLAEPVNDRIFFAGEAFYRGQETATVEGALASGKETAERILRL